MNLKKYKGHPGSLILVILVILAAVITFSVLLFLIAYILIKGVPHLKPSLFAWEYTSDNVSMMPAIINTIDYDAGVPGDCRTVWYFLCHLSGRVCKAWQ